MTGDYVCESRINETTTLKKMFTINYVGECTPSWFVGEGSNGGGGAVLKDLLN